MEILGRGIKKPAVKTAKKVWKVARWFNPVTAVSSIAYNKAKGRKAFAGEEILGFNPTWNDVLSGAAKKKGKFLPGLTKVVKKIGKVTSPITTAAARAFLPASVVNAAAKLDPTKRGLITPKAVAAVQTLTTAAQVEKTEAFDKAEAKGPEGEALIKTLTNPKVLAVIAGGAVILFVMSKKRR
jgi:hypothetical protein